MENEEYKDGNEENSEIEECPECKQITLKTKWSGIECTNPKCKYWFCY